MSVTEICEDLKPHRIPAFLPPCQVCGGKATGLHYGKNTCGACKGFFRRSIHRKKPYVSECLGSCDIGPDQIKLCSSCRFRKCLLIGMSESGIKIGRYTHKRRTLNTLEVKKIQQKALRATEPLEQLTIPKSPKPWMSLALDEIIRNTVEVHDEIAKHSHIREEDIKERQRTYYEEHKLELELFGQRATLPKDQYDEIYHLTGIDIDGRQDIMRIVLEQFEHGLREFVAFAKRIPKFTCISIVDQASLVQSSAIEFILLECFPGVSGEMQILVLLKRGVCFHLDELSRVYHSDLLKMCADAAISLQKLKVKHEEVVILEAISVLFSDRCDLQEPEKVDDLQWKMIQCLMYLLEKNHKGDPRMFAHVMDRLSDMRVLTESVRKIAPETLLWPCVDQYPLYTEIASAL